MGVMGSDDMSVPGVVTASTRSRAAFEEEDDYCSPTEHTDWIPHHIMTEWKNNEGVRCLTILVNLSSGTANTTSDGIDVDLDNDGNTLTIAEVWSDMTQDLDIFYSRFKKKSGESLDDYTMRRFQMREALNVMKQKFADPDNKMVSIFRKSLPFRVEPTEMVIDYSGDKVGGRYCHIGLIEKKLQTVHSVMMMDDVVNENVPPSEQKKKYKRSRS